jgi:glycosyltransferase involved in cell wall biosynthesis
MVSVVVVTYNSAETIGETLASLGSQDYPAASYEVIVVDGGSSDGTAEIVEGYDVEFLVAPDATIGACRNRGIEAAEGEYIAFTDSDCAVPADWLSTHVSQLSSQRSRDHVVGVGGPNRAFPDDPPFARLVESFQGTAFGSGGSPQSRTITDHRLVRSVAACNVVYDAAVFKTHRFDDAINVGEDAEFHFRLSEAGYRFVFDPDNAVSHHLSTDLRSFSRKSRSYGYAMARIQRRHGRVIRWYSPLPSAGLLVSTLAGLADLSSGRLRYVAVLACLFVPIATYVTWAVFRDLQRPLALLAPVLLIAQYLWYGIGFLEGMAADAPWPLRSTERQ